MLELIDIWKTFSAATANEVCALRGVDFHIEEGSFVVVVGSNGSGKSTLLNAISGSVPIDEGQITLCGHDVTKWPEHRRASYIGRVFQDPFAGTASGMTIAENFSLASRRGCSRYLELAQTAKFRNEVRERIASLKLGLEARLDVPIGILSGGQRQALTLLMATWHKPELLLLDEHTAALDPSSASKVIELTEKIIRENSLTALMVTHSMSQAVHFGDRLVMMYQGKIIRDFEGQSKRRLCADEILREFDEIRTKELLDESAAQLLEEQYI